MKFLKNSVKLVIIWMISILAFSIGFTIFIIFQTNSSFVTNSPELVMIGYLSIIWFIASFFFGLLSSIPGFIFFALFGSIVLAIPVNQNAKKVVLILINIMNLFIHGCIGYFILKDSAFVPGAFSTLGKYIMWLPNWTLFIASNLSIVLLNFSTTPKNKQL